MNDFIYKERKEIKYNKRRHATSSVGLQLKFNLLKWKGEENGKTESIIRRVMKFVMCEKKKKKITFKCS